jgi:hypothetical protein
MPITLNGSTGLVTPGMTLGSSVVEVPSGSAPSYTCRAWVNFNGTSTVAIRASGNVSSITDHGTGQFSINFTVAMPDTNYAAVGTGGASGNSDAVGVQCPNIIATSSYRFGVTNSGGTLSDRDTNYVAIFR